MDGSNGMSNDDIRSRIYNKASPFICGVDPYLLIQPLINENVITTEEWQQIEKEYERKRQRCRLLYNHLKRSSHPRAFVIVKETLEKHEDPFLNELHDVPSTSNDGASEHSAVSNDYVQPITISSLQERVENLEKERDDERKERDEARKERDEARGQLTDLKQRLDTLEALLKSGKRKRAVDEPKVIKKKQSGNATATIIESKEIFTLSGIRQIFGVAKLHQRIYIACQNEANERNSCEIRVFKDGNGFPLEREIPVNVNGYPMCLTSSDRSNCLYFINRSDKIIWVVELAELSTNGCLVKEWLRLSYSPFLLSESHDGHLLVSSYGDDDMGPPMVEIYDVSNSSVIRSCRFSDDVCRRGWRVIEKPNGQFIMLACAKGAKGPWFIIQLDRDGKVIGEFNRSKSPKVNNSCYLYFDTRKDRVLVCDTSKRSVYLFDANSLNFIETLLSAKDIPPHPGWLYLCYDETKRQLIIGFGNSIRVYEIC